MNQVSNLRTKEWFPYIIVSHFLHYILITFHKQFSIDHAIDFITFMFYILYISYRWDFGIVDVA